MVYPYKYPFRIFDFEQPIGSFCISSQKRCSFGKNNLQKYELETAYHNSNLSFSAKRKNP